MMEEDEEGLALLGQLLGVLEGDLPDEGDAVLPHPTSSTANILAAPLATPWSGNS